MGNGLKTLENVPENSTIFTVETEVAGGKMNQLDPLKEKLTTPVLKYVEETQLQGEPHISQRMRVAFQFSSILRDFTHQLYPYLDSLPLDNLQFPLYWKTPSASFSPRLREEVVTSITATRNLYDKIYSSERKMLSNVTFEEFIWTHYMADSRCVRGNTGSMTFVPIVDFINHSFELENCRVEKVGDVWTVKSTKNIDANSQLFVNYGPFDSYKYITQFGFFPPKNPFQCVYFQPELLPDWANFLETAKLSSKTPISELTNVSNFTIPQLKKRLLQKHKLSILSVPISIQPPSFLAEAAFRVFFLEISDLKQLKYTDIDEVIEKLNPMEVISKENERKVREMMVKMVMFAMQCSAEDWKPEVEMCAELEKEEREILVRTRDYYLSQQKVTVTASRDS